MTGDRDRPTVTLTVDRRGYVTRTMRSGATIRVGHVRARFGWAGGYGKQLRDRAAALRTDTDRSTR
jgi:hypothetical protein